jgi:hypothetical protein
MSKRIIITGIIAAAIFAIPMLSSADPGRSATRTSDAVTDPGPMACISKGGSCKDNNDCCNYSCQWDNDKQKNRCDK